MMRFEANLALGLAACAAMATAACGDDSQTTGGAGGTGGNDSTSSSPTTGVTASTTQATASSGSTTTESTGSAAFTGDVLRYDYTLDMGTLAATSKVSGVANATGACFAVACEPIPADASLGGVPASVAASPGQIEVCGSEVTEGSTFDLVTHQTVVEDTYLPGLDVGFSRIPNLGGGTFSYLLSWVGGCDHFGPCDDDPSRLVNFTFDVSHDPATTVLCPGVRTTPAAGQTRCELLGTPAPTYSGFAVAADDRWVANPFVTSSGVDFVFYEAPQGTIADSIDPQELDAFFTWLTGRWGAFPYGNQIRVASGPTAWLGFEHPANIILFEEIDRIATSYQNAPLHVLMHEIVHQWSGDKTTLASPLDFVWKEAIAEYTAYVWEDMSRPAAEAASSLAYWDAISLQAGYYPRPQDDPPPAVEDFYGDVYGPGPMTLFVQLERIVGRDAVLAGIDAFLSGSNAKRVEDLRDAIAAAAGVSLDTYFDMWVFGTGAPDWPTYQVTTTQNGPDLDLTVTQTNAVDGKAHPASIELRVVTPTTTYNVEVGFALEPTTATLTATVQGATGPATITVDPRHYLVNRVANAAPPEPLPVWIF